MWSGGNIFSRNLWLDDVSLHALKYLTATVKHTWGCVDEDTAPKV